MVGPGRGTWIFAKPKNSLQSNEWIFQVNTFRWKGSNPVEESHWFLVACTFIIEPSGHVFGKNLGTRPGNSWECEAFQCEVFMAQELSVFFLREMSFLIPKNCSGSWCASWVWHIFSQPKYVRGDEDEDLDAKGVPTVPYLLVWAQQVEKLEWEILKNTDEFLPWVQSPLHQVTVNCQPFILLCLPCFRCSASSGCFGRRRFRKILDTKITHRPRRWDHHSFSDGGEFFQAASWRVLFGGVKMVGDTWYVLNLVDRHMDVGDLMAPEAWLKNCGCWIHGRYVSFRIKKGWWFQAFLIFHPFNLEMIQID